MPKSEGAYRELQKMPNHSIESFIKYDDDDHDDDDDDDKLPNPNRVYSTGAYVPILPLPVL